MAVYHLLTHVPEALFPDLTEIYRQAYGPPPYSKGEEEVIEFAYSLPDYVQRTDFRMLTASAGEGVIGFAFGFRSDPLHFWHQVIGSLLSPEAAAEWLADAFKLAEIALLPDYQGQGIGGQLHDRLLVDLPHRCAVLTTLSADTNAFRLYKRRGWQILLEGFTPPAMIRVYRMMGLRFSH